MRKAEVTGPICAKMARIEAMTCVSFPGLCAGGVRESCIGVVARAIAISREPSPSGLPEGKARHGKGACENSDYREDPECQDWSHQRGC